MTEGAHFLSEHDRKDTNDKDVQNVVRENVSSL